MTKYILHGGETKRDSKYNKKFFFETTRGLSGPVTILCIYFAGDKDRWPKSFEQDKINFSSAAPKKDLNFVLAIDDINILKNQIKNADVIYLRGGITERLKKALSKVKNLEQLWLGKVVAGSSAGAYVLSKYYYSNSLDQLGQGFGILPIKTFCHYTKQKDDKFNQLKNYKEDLKIYKIPEEKFVVIKK